MYCVEDKYAIRLQNHCPTMYIEQKVYSSFQRSIFWKIELKLFCGRRTQTQFLIVKEKHTRKYAHRFISLIIIIVFDFIALKSHIVIITLNFSTFFLYIFLLGHSPIRFSSAVKHPPKLSGTRRNSLVFLCIYLYSISVVITQVLYSVSESFI